MLPEVYLSTSVCVVRRELLSHKSTKSTTYHQVFPQINSTNSHSCLQHVRVLVETHLWQSSVLPGFQFFSACWVWISLSFLMDISEVFSDMNIFSQVISHSPLLWIVSYTLTNFLLGCPCFSNRFGKVL